MSQGRPTQKHPRSIGTSLPCMKGLALLPVYVPCPATEQTTTVQWVGLSMVPRFLHNKSQPVSCSHIGTHGCVSPPVTLASQCTAAACACSSAGGSDMHKWQVPGWGPWPPYAAGRSENSLFHRGRRLLSCCCGGVFPQSQATRHPNSCSQYARKEVAPGAVHPGHFGRARQDDT